MFNTCMVHFKLACMHAYSINNLKMQVLDYKTKGKVMINSINEKLIEYASKWNSLHNKDKCQSCLVGKDYLNYHNECKLDHMLYRFSQSSHYNYGNVYLFL